MTFLDIVTYSFLEDVFVVTLTALEKSQSELQKKQQKTSWFSVLQEDRDGKTGLFLDSKTWHCFLLPSKLQQSVCSCSFSDI